MSVVERFIESTVSDPIANAFIIGIAGYLLLSLVLLAIPKTRSSRFVRTSATVLTTLGVLGTFCGIFLGLLNFNVTDIDGSIGPLLAGLRIAFSTSIAGMAAALIFRLTQTITPVSATGGATEAEAIRLLLTEIRDNAKQRQEDQLKVLGELKTAIASDGDASVVTQIQKTRTVLKDGQDDLISEFRSFAEKMNEMATGALVDALRDVIKDFNQNLPEQFGENFKELNRAVSKLVQWQDNYRTHVEQFETRLQNAVKGIEASESALAKVREHCEAIPQSVHKLEPVLTAIDLQTKDLEGHFGAMSALRAQALEAFPVIDKNLKSMTEEFGKSVIQAVNNSQEILEQQKSAQGVLNIGFENLRSQASEAQQLLQAGLEQSMTAMQRDLNEALTKYEGVIDKTTKEISDQVSKSFDESSNKISQDFQQFDEQMQDEIKRAIAAMGSQLASLSEKFADDYRPLTEHLRSFLQAAKV